MKNFTYKLICFAMVFSCLSLTAQEKNAEQFRNCTTDEYNAQLLIDNPKMMGSEAFERQLAPKIAEIKRQLESGSSRALQFTIPVVIHVIHNGEPIGTGANISDAQALSQIQVLNEDFRRIVGSRGFNNDPNGADVEVEFCLAKQDPDGCVTTGIDRIDMSAVSTTWGGSGPTSNTNTILKPTTTWDASQYMNMWSVNFADNTLLGFAQFPGGPANTDGVVSNYTYFGSNDAAGVSIPGVFNLGRTMTHEVGHYLGLYHTFQGGCFGNGDFCDDTPPVASANSNGSACNPNNSCSNDSPDLVDMIENYMDYTTDACMNIFTNDQKARVIAVMNAGVNRPNTTTSDKCTPLADVSNDGSIEINGLTPGAACSGEVVPSIRIQNFGTVTLTSATVSYDVDGGTSTDYAWTGNLANGAFVDLDLPVITADAGEHTLNVSIASPNGNADERACNDVTSANFSGSDSYAGTSQVHLTLLTDTYCEETDWEFRDSNNTLIASGGNYTQNAQDNTIFNESFDVVPNECYTFTITDTAGDGICCAYGNGSYELTTDDDSIIFSGGEFGATESTQISTFALSVDDYFAGSNLYVYPNPTNNQLNIKLGNTNDLPNSYEIVNMLGQSITKNAIVTNEDLAINTSTLSNGMYFIRIIKDDASVTLPFIKK
nr:M43 family zinc metalloprotease [uncultured Psychroserpens sp.]